jgi:hypothetical protein
MTAGNADEYPEATLAPNGTESATEDKWLHNGWTESAVEYREERDRRYPIRVAKVPNNQGIRVVPGQIHKTGPMQRKR